MIGEAGRKSEKLLAKKLGLRLRPASGAVPGMKGDMGDDKILLEAKSTTGRSIGLQHAWLSKIAKEAREAGKIPALAVSFINENGTHCPNGEWVCIPLGDWTDLVIKLQGGGDEF